ncbi:MAG: hypothetical protein RIR76_1783 [Verrucomicrobiota bacterium]|jgi:hypothetical protein
MNLRRLADLFPGKNRWCRCLLKLPLSLFRTGSWPLSSWLARDDASTPVDEISSTPAEFAPPWQETAVSSPG